MQNRRPIQVHKKLMSFPVPAFSAKPCLLHVSGKSGGLAQAIIRILKNRIPRNFRIPPSGRAVAQLGVQDMVKML
jgi:hypothetical protein